MGHRQPKEDPLKTFIVLRPIGMSGRVEAGAKVQLRESEAKNYPPDFLKEVKEEVAAPAVQNDGGDADSKKDDGTGSAGDQVKTVDHVVTQDDLDKDPALAATGIAVGQTIQVPAPKE